MVPPWQPWVGNVHCTTVRSSGKTSRGVFKRHTKPSTRSGLRLIPASHCIRWSEANARRNKVFLANVPWVARHLDSKTHLTTKEEYVWEDAHDADLLSWAVADGDILHRTRSFGNVA